MATVTRREFETVDELIKRFSKKVAEEGIMKELRDREYYKSKGQRRREQEQEEARNAWIAKKRAERYGKRF